MMAMMMSMQFAVPAFILRRRGGSPLPLQLAVSLMCDVYGQPRQGDRRVVGIYTCADNNWPEDSSRRLCGSVGTFSRRTHCYYKLSKILVDNTFLDKNKKQKNM